jgi:serine protease AprX
MRWGKRFFAVATSVLVGAGALVASPSGASAGLLGNETVIVTATGVLSPVTAVLQVGGTVLTQYSIINGVEASIPTALASVLSALPGITVTPDVQVSVQQMPASKPGTQPSAVFPQTTGASTLAAAGDTGQGVTVAVLDTGIDNLPDFSGRLIGGVDLSGGHNPYNDQYGHGTFVAGLIAGNGASSGGQYTGEATGANLVAVKVAGASGTTDLATVISGVQWAVVNQAVYGIRVLNMSLGFQPFTSTVINPLDMAVEAAWNSGIAVVTSAGNAGPFNGTILSPGDDPLVITVGALNDNGSTDPGDATMTDFSSVGPTNPDGWVKPDLVTSGRSVISLAAPGSTIYNSYPSARIGSGNFVGSGTSFSAAITSGAAALILADNPGSTPNQIKARLLGYANPGPVGDPFVDGHGALNVFEAATSAPVDLQQSTLGEAATAVGSTVSLSTTWASSTWNPNVWTGGQWNGGQWNGGQWNGGQWNGYQWNGGQWNGMAWNGGQWNGGQWNGGQWNAAAWNGGQWNGGQWNGGQWNGSAWNGGQWNGGQWNGAAWNGGQWNGSSWS